MKKRFAFFLLLLIGVFFCTQLFAQQKKKKVAPKKVHNFASFYLGKFHNRPTASGELYNKNDFTCAHRKFKFGTLIKVTNLKNGKSVIVRVNDRGPYAKKRVVDLSKAAAQCIDMIPQGITRVKITKVATDSLLQPGNVELFSTDTTYSLYGTTTSLNYPAIFLWKTQKIDHLLALASSMTARLPANEMVIRKRTVGKKNSYELHLKCSQEESEKLMREVWYLGFFKARLQL